MMPFFIFFIFRELVIDRILFERCLAMENTFLMWSRGGGKWFILYQSNKHYFIWAMIWCPFFHFSHISGAGNWLRTKELNLKMSCGRKCFGFGKCLIAENVWWWKKLQPRVCLGGKLLVLKKSLRKIPCGGKYLAVENVWPSKKLQPLSESEEKHHLHRPQPIQLLVRGGGGGKWFILYQSNIHYSIWAMKWYPFFQLFHILGAGNWMSAKGLKLKMSCGRNWFQCGGDLNVEKVAAKGVWEENNLQFKISGPYLSSFWPTWMD